jgi:hypothetical protein
VLNTFHGDVSNRDDIIRLRERIEMALPDKVETNYVLVAYNKNSYGPDTLAKALSNLDNVFDRYAYIYQNPVHRSTLKSAGLIIHRLSLDRSFRKNRDWLLATRD